MMVTDLVHKKLLGRSTYAMFASGCIYDTTVWNLAWNGSDHSSSNETPLWMMVYFHQTTVSQNVVAEFVNCHHHHQLNVHFLPKPIKLKYSVYNLVLCPINTCDSFCWPGKRGSEDTLTHQVLKVRRSVLIIISYLNFEHTLQIPNTIREFIQV